MESTLFPHMVRVARKMMAAGASLLKEGDIVAIAYEDGFTQDERDEAERLGYERAARLALKSVDRSAGRFPDTSLFEWADGGLPHLGGGRRARSTVNSDYYTRLIDHMNKTIESFIRHRDRLIAMRNALLAEERKATPDQPQEQQKPHE